VKHKKRKKKKGNPQKKKIVYRHVNKQKKTR
jgi:hypothetical protein